MIVQCPSCEEETAVYSENLRINGAEPIRLAVQCSECKRWVPFTVRVGKSTKRRPSWLVQEESDRG